MTGPTESAEATKGYTQAFNEAMLDIGERYPDVVADDGGHARPDRTAALRRSAGPTGSSTSGSPSRPR